MNAVAAWVRFDLRTRARSLAFLALLVAVTTATLITATAGARRGASTVDRLLARTLPATIAVLPNQADFDWDAVRAIPGVEALARFVVTGLEVEELSVPGVAELPFADPSVMDTVERPVVLEGRLADPGRADEAVVTARLEAARRIGVGDTVTFLLHDPAQIDGGYDSAAPPPPAGPRVEARVVGVVRSGWFSDTDGSPGQVIPSPGLFRAYEANLVGTGPTAHLNALVRLEGGGAAIPAFRERLATVTGRRDIEFFDLSEMAAHAADVARFEANSLLAFALAAGVAALFLVGQSVTRSSSAAAADLDLLRAFGMTPRQRRLGVTIGPSLAALLGALAGGGASYVLSGRFPIGTAGPLEPSPGRFADVPVLLAGVVGIPVLVGAGAWVVAWAAMRRTSAVREPRPSAVAALVGRWNLPVPLAVGTRFALERGRGRQAVPVRPALLGAMVGVLGVVAALTFADGVSDASSNPARFGQVSELQAYLGFNDGDFAPAEDVLGLAAADPDVTAVNDTRQAVGEVGGVDVPVFTLDPVAAPLPVVVTAGRLPARAGEITMAPATADAVGAAVGDTVRFVGTRATTSVTVTGLAFVPIGSHNDYDVGAWTSKETYDELFGGFKFHSGDVAVRAGADPQTVADRINASVAGALGLPPEERLIEVRPPPARLSELEQIRRIPLFLAAFLALLAVGAIGHVLATTVRRRRSDIAVLRALGVTRRQSWATVATQASVLAVFGLVSGVPLGVALGQTLWRSVADSTPVDYVSPAAVGVLILVVPATVMIVNVLAAWPSHRAASLRIGQVLRTE